MQETFNGILDPHSHSFPEFYIETMKNELGIPNCGGAPWPKWSPELLVQMMDKKGIARSILSYSTPGVWFKNNRWSRDFCRMCNEYLAEIAGRYPGRIGGFACLPLPDSEGAAEEAVYALDELGLDGIGILSNAKGTYPESPAYRPVYEVLNARSATVFIHPADPPTGLTTGMLNIFYGWFIDTTRAVLGIAEAELLERYPRVRYILAHAGGVFPALSDLARHANLYYDTAKAVSSPVLDRLFASVDADHVLFGSDYPMANAQKISYWYTNLAAYFEDDPEGLENLLKRNVRPLIEHTAAGMEAGL